MLKIKTVATFDEYIEARRVKEEAQRRFELAESSLLADMARSADKTRVSTDGGKKRQATYVQTMKTVIDEEALKKKLGAVKYRKLCRQVLDKKMVEAALNNGELEQSVLEPLVTEEPNKPYIRYTENAVGDDS